MTTFIPAQSGLTLVFIENESGKPQPVEIVGYQVNDKGKVSPLTYPEVPAGAQVFVTRDGGVKPFDLATGRAIGQTTTAPKWVKA